MELDLVSIEINDNSVFRAIIESEDGVTIGKIIVFRFGKMAVIEAISVNSSFRRQSVGTDLLNEAEEWAAEVGVKKLFFRFAPCDLLPTDLFLSKKFFVSHGYKFKLIKMGFEKQI